MTSSRTGRYRRSMRCQSTASGRLWERSANCRADSPPSGRRTIRFRAWSWPALPVLSGVVQSPVLRGRLYYWPVTETPSVGVDLFDVDRLRLEEVDAPRLTPEDRLARDRVWDRAVEANTR